MKTYNFSITLKQNSDNIKWVEDVLHSGLNPGESVIFLENNGSYQQIIDVLRSFNLSLDPVNLYDELENLLDLVNELKQDINTLNDLLAK